MTTINDMAPARATKSVGRFGIPGMSVGSAWRPRTNWGEPALVEICSKLAIDVRADQRLECIGKVAVFVVAAFGPFLRKRSVRHDIFEQLTIRTVGQAQDVEKALSECAVHVC